jgi:cell division protease FtsH
MKVPGQPKQGRFLFLYLMALALALWFWQNAANLAGVRTISYSEFKTYVGNHEVVECTIKDEEITGRIVPRAKAASSPETLPATDSNVVTTPFAASDKPTEADGDPFYFRTLRVEDPKLVEQLEAAGTKYVGARSPYWMKFLLIALIPIALLVVLSSLLGRAMGTAGESILSFGRSKARLVADKDTGVSFQDVAGCDEAKFELQEVVEFLKHPEEFRTRPA